MNQRPEYYVSEETIQKQPFHWLELENQVK